ncbi:MAG: hypothetical protein O7I42_03325 [Alphaproteobacteria bacterium]|nr:hypothetical protein [Alphaproteobacteria bacterium]
MVDDIDRKDKIEAVGLVFEMFRRSFRERDLATSPPRAWARLRISRDGSTP